MNTTLGTILDGWGVSPVRYGTMKEQIPDRLAHIIATDVLGTRLVDSFGVRLRVGACHPSQYVEFLYPEPDTLELRADHVDSLSVQRDRCNQFLRELTNSLQDRGLRVGCKMVHNPNHFVARIWLFAP